MSSDSNQNGGHDEHHAHALPIPLLVGVWVALMFLTWVTVFVAGLDLGKADFAVAMIIATVKVALVCLVFMHLLWDKGFHSVLVVSGVLLLGLFLGATLFDREHYQDSIDAHERDHPFQRRFEVVTFEGHGEAGEHGTEGGQDPADQPENGEGNPAPEGDQEGE